MLVLISWGQFFASILVLAAIYYLIITVLYYRHDLLNLAQRKKPITKPGPSPIEKKADHNSFTAEDDLFVAVSELKAALQEAFERGAEKRWIKEELLTALQVQLRQYHQLKGTAFQVAINNHIGQQAQQQCEIILEEIEIKQIW